MIIIQHRKEPDTRYFLIDCECGCKFVCGYSEFTRYKVQEKPYPFIPPPDIRCPECDTRICLPKNISMYDCINGVFEISRNDYIEIKKRFKEVQK